MAGSFIDAAYSARINSLPEALIHRLFVRTAECWLFCWELHFFGIKGDADKGAGFFYGASGIMRPLTRFSGLDKKLDFDLSFSANI